MGSLNNLKEFYQKCKRVWLVMKRPTKKEFNLISKVTAIGILIIGFVGFIISIIVSLF
jgi:protein transport protein SEC61 subunit gamma and related proteins